jgi:hypothetical protein
VSRRLFATPFGGIIACKSGIDGGLWQLAQLNGAVLNIEFALRKFGFL